MKCLKENGYNVISLNELYQYYTEGTPIPKNSVVITFDDGYENNYVYAYPILKEFGYKATIFVITSKINETGYMTTDQLKELDKNGVDIEAHTVTHPKLGLLPTEKQLYELKESKVALESMLGRDIKYVAYPYGEFNKDTIRIVSKLNYKLGVGTVCQKARKRDGIYQLSRTGVSGKINIKQFKELFNKK